MIRASWAGRIPVSVALEKGPGRGGVCTPRHFGRLVPSKSIEEGDEHGNVAYTVA
jgi:hypothetical protein